MSFDEKDVTLESEGRTLVVPKVKGWHCPACGEIEFVGNGSAERYAIALDALSASLDG
jgi:HTH-type transcriptional regulator/antitoxin MqsA